MVSHILFSQRLDNKNHSLEQLREIFHQTTDTQQLVTALTKILDENFRYYQIIKDSKEASAMLTALSLAIEYSNITAFDIIFEKYNNIHYSDVLASLECPQHDYLRKFIHNKPFKTFEYLLQIALQNHNKNLLEKEKTMAAMSEIIDLKGSAFLTEKTFKTYDNAHGWQSPLSAAVSHYHLPLIDFFIKKGASPNSELDGEDGASLIDACAYHWYDKQQHAPTGLTATCLTLIRLGARLDNLTVDIKTQLLQAAIAHQDRSAALRLLGLNDSEKNIQYRPKRFSLFSLGGWISQQFNFNANPYALTAQEYSSLLLLIEQNKHSTRPKNN